VACGGILALASVTVSVTMNVPLSVGVALQGYSTGHAVTELHA